MMFGLGTLFDGFPIVIKESNLKANVQVDDETLGIEPVAMAKERWQEFKTGRFCAWRALNALGVSQPKVFRNQDRSPRWPSGVVGSITHTREVHGGFCGVAVAKKCDILALGLDSEPAIELPSDLWDTVLDQDEKIVWGKPGSPKVGTRVVFSAKEAVYKAIYPLTRQFLHFHQVNIQLFPPSRFEARLRGCASAHRFALRPLVGRYSQQDGLILTGIALMQGQPEVGTYFQNTNSA